MRLHCTCCNLLSAAQCEAIRSPLPHAPILVLFSGGVDSTLIAALVHEVLPPGLPVDLASVCFDGGNSPDRQSALDALQVAFSVKHMA